MLLLMLAIAVQPTSPQIKNDSLFVPDDYPRALSESGIHGRVSFTLDVSPNGRATACHITSGSGNAKLDELTCRLAQRRASFVPAKDAEGNPIAGTWSSSTRWLKSSAVPPPWRVSFKTQDGKTTCLATNDKIERLVRSDICEKMANSFRDHAKPPSNLRADLTEEMLEPLSPN